MAGVPPPAPGCALALEDDPLDVAAAPETALSPAWEYAPPDGWTVRFDGVQDAAGNVYWQEWRTDGTAGGAVGSATWDGALRWRTEVDAVQVWLVSGGRVVVSVSPPGAPTGADPTTPARLVALDGATGGQAWSVDVARETAALVPSDRGPPRPGVRVDHPAVLGGAVTFPVSTVDQAGYVWPGLLRVDLATGAVRELRAIATELTIWIPGEPAASAGVTYAIVRPTQLSAALLGFDASGAAEIALPLRPDDNLWLTGASERYLLASGALGSPTTGAPFLQWSALDGTPRGRVAVPWASAELLASGSAGYVAGTGRLARVDLEACTMTWARTLVRAPPGDRTRRPLVSQSDPIVTSRGGVLLSEQVQLSDGTSVGTVPDVARVLEVGTGGAELFRGRLPDGLFYGGGATLHRGRWVTAAAPRVSQAHLQAFDLAGQEPAATGWTTRHGDVARDRRAR